MITSAILNFEFAQIQNEKKEKEEEEEAKISGIVVWPASI